MGSSQFSPPILNIFKWVPVTQPVAPQQWGDQGGGGGEGVIGLGLGIRIEKRPDIFCWRHKLRVSGPAPRPRVNAGLPLWVRYPLPKKCTYIGVVWMKKNESLHLARLFNYLDWVPRIHLKGGIVILEIIIVITNVYMISHACVWSVFGCHF